MKLVVIGTGYVGTVTAVILSNKSDFEVVGIDKDEDKVRRLNSGDPIISEPFLEEYLKCELDKKKIRFSTNYEEIADAQIVMTCVGTPSRPDGNVNLEYIFNTAEIFAQYSKSPRALFVIKSTVPPGTARYVQELINGKLDNRTVVSNPEFLKEGSAVSDFLTGKRIIIGAPHGGSDYVYEMMEELYKNFLTIIPIWMTNESAELAKYACNTFLAMKITYANFIAHTSELVGADSQDVLKVMKKDPRIGELFLEPGMGFGGSCFPKDVWGLQYITESPLLKEVLEYNEESMWWPIKKLEKIYSGHKEDIHDKRVAFLGLTFKPGTDDCRESPTMYAIKKFYEEFVFYPGKIYLWDSKNVIDTFQLNCEVRGIDLTNSEFTTSIKEVLENSDIIIICVDDPVLKEQHMGFAKFLNNSEHLLIDARGTLRGGFKHRSNYRCIGLK